MTADRPLTIRERLELEAKHAAWELRPGPGAEVYPPQVWARVVFGGDRCSQHLPGCTRGPLE